MDTEIKELIMAACRTPAERKLMFLLSECVKENTEALHKLTALLEKPNDPVVTKPPTKKKAPAKKETTE